MKTIGLLGGMSWASTLDYYRHINSGINERLGGLHSAKIALYSVDFDPLEQGMNSGDWNTVQAHLEDGAKRVEAAGADFLLICTNTMHKLAPKVAEAVNIPLLHIADATAEAVKEQGIERVGLLGTKFTMEEGFYAGRLREKHGLEVIVPDCDGRKRVNCIIFDELCMNVVKEESVMVYADIVASMIDNGAQGIILGCTEIAMLVKDAAVPVFDTTELHCKAAVERALTD